MKISSFIVLFFGFLLFVSCEKKEYDIEYQDGYPNILAGNWIASDYQIPKENYAKVLDTINDFDLNNLGQFSQFINTLDLISQSDDYEFVSALDPNTDSLLVLSNIYGSGIRTKVKYNHKKLESRFSDQLEIINYGGYGIYYTSVSGQLVQDEENGDFLCLIIGIYDKDKELFDSMLMIAYRKTGFEDTNYQSLLDN